MRNIATRSLHLAGFETRTERRFWENRQIDLETSVLFPYSDEAFKDEVDLLESLDITVAYRQIVYRAEERVRLRALCAGRLALPAEGANEKELHKLGFNVGMYPRVRSGLRLVEFPPRWTMEPTVLEPSLERTGNAIVRDDEGMERITVLFQSSIAGMIRNQLTTIIDQ